MDVSVGTCYFHLHGGSEEWLRSSYRHVARKGPFRYTGGEGKVKPSLSGQVMSLPSSIQLTNFTE
jgi:hypothetical protein